MVAGISTKAFCLLNQIIASPIAAITVQNLIQHFGSEGRELIELGALVPTAHCKYIESMSDHEGRLVEITRCDDGFAYFSLIAGWVPVLYQDILLYKTSNEWLISTIKSSLGISETASKQIEEHIWALGDAWLKYMRVPIILASNLRQQIVYETLNRYLLERHSKRPALVLALDLKLPPYLSLPKQNKLIIIQDAMLFNRKEFALDILFLSEKMGANIMQHGFSNGYRNLSANGEVYKLSNQQASILEVLDKACCLMHKYEIMASSESTQNELEWVFRKNGKYHPAWGEVIKYDSKGNYWLEY